jgi:HAE1 family hydrophobic/amphiphilic exporter-1
MKNYNITTIVFLLLVVVSTTQAQNLSKDNLSKNNSTNETFTVSIQKKRVGVDEGKVLSLSLQEAIERALENNLDIKIERRKIQIAQNNLLSATGAYSVNLGFNYQFEDDRNPFTSTFNQSINRLERPQFLTNETHSLNSIISKKFSSGGIFTVDFTNRRLVTDEFFTRLETEYRSNLIVKFHQPFLRNFRINEEQRIIKAKRKELDISDLAFRQKLINLIAETQTAYYELVFAIKNEEIYREAVELAATQLNKTQTQIEAGRAANVEAVSAQAHLELRNSEHLSSLLVITKAENHLKKLMFDDPNTVFWSYSILPTDSINFTPLPSDLDKSMSIALAQRIELKDLDAKSEISKVNISFFKNQLKPRLDGFGTFLGQGLSGNRNFNNAQISFSFNLDKIILGNYFQTLTNIFRFRTYTGGAVFSYSLGNQIARANRDNTLIVDQQLDEKKKLTIQKIMVEVRNSTQAIETAIQRVKATKAAVDAATEQLTAEEIKYEAGLSTNFIVFSRQNLLSFAYSRHLKALTDYQKAEIELQRVMGNNLQGFIKD